MPKKRFSAEQSDLGGVRMFTMAQSAHPRHRSRECEHKGLIDAPGFSRGTARDENLLALPVGGEVAGES
jgi:hypothetical protein